MTYLPWQYTIDNRTRDTARGKYNEGPPLLRKRGYWPTFPIHRKLTCLTPPPLDRFLYSPLMVWLKEKVENFICFNQLGIWKSYINENLFLKSLGSIGINSRMINSQISKDNYIFIWKFPEIKLYINIRFWYFFHWIAYSQFWKKIILKTEIVSSLA